MLRHEANKVSSEFIRVFDLNMPADFLLVTFHLVRLTVPPVASTKMAVFWDAVPCSLAEADISKVLPLVRQI
jgi:hypothetical protein